MSYSAINERVAEIKIPLFSNYASVKDLAYLEFGWEGIIQSTGLVTTMTSFTSLFGIINEGTRPSDLPRVEKFQGSASSPASQFSDVPGSPAGESSVPRPTGAVSAGGDGNTAPGSPPPSASPSVSAESAPSSASGGLAQGAIIGIAVAAAVVGLALIGLLVFCLLRRRRRQQSDHVSALAHPYKRDQHTATADLMGEKEAAAGGMGESPHSPYTDDGHGSLPHTREISGPSAAVGAAGVAAGAGAASAHHHHGSPPAPAQADLHRSSFTPYSDDGTAVASGHADADRATAASRAETPGGRYEHLMEQGMSAEDRLRVEEEERQLDAEIAARK